MGATRIEGLTDSPAAVVTPSEAVSTTTTGAASGKRRHDDGTADVQDGLRFLDMMSQMVAVRQQATTGAASRPVALDADTEARLAMRHWDVSQLTASVKTSVVGEGAKTALLNSAQSVDTEERPGVSASKSTDTPNGAPLKVKLSPAETEAIQQWLQQHPEGLPLPGQGQIAFNGISAQQQLTAASQLGAPGRQFFAIQEKLSQWLQHAYQTGRPIRLELDNEQTLLLRIRQGKVSAEWLLTGRASQQLASLAAQVDSLRQRLQERDLPVESFTVRPDGQPGKRQQPQQEKEGSESSAS